MKIERIQIEDRDSLLTRLIGQVFHLTTRAAYEKIKKSGEISNNQLGDYPINTGSQESYGRLNGCVCLFDLRDNNPEIIERTLECYYFLGPSWFARHGTKYNTWDLAYLFLSPQYYNLLIPNFKQRLHYKETGRFLQAIHSSEVWIENKIPFSCIENVLLVKIKKLTHPTEIAYYSALELLKNSGRP